MDKYIVYAMKKIRPNCFDVIIILFFSCTKKNFRVMRKRSVESVNQIQNCVVYKLRIISLSVTTLIKS